MAILDNSGTAAIIGMLRTALIVKSLAILLFTYGVSGLRLTKIHMPSKGVVGESIWLNCSYDLETDQLYSIKWFKGQEEIYRFLPSADSPKTRYDAVGLNVDLAKSNFGNIFVDLLDPESAGEYRCEVSADAPSFQTLRSESQTLLVYLRPKRQKSKNLNLTGARTSSINASTSWRPDMSVYVTMSLLILWMGWDN